MKKLIAILLVLTAAAVSGFLVHRKGNEKSEVFTIEVIRGEIELAISAYGVVKPRNRLEIRPPFAGRMEEILVKEGQTVEKGTILAWMSSQDRAALMDIARSRGESEVDKWEDVYKRAPVVAHLSGFIIRRSAEPGQSVSSGEAIIVMADELVVQAQVDETDIGKIKAGYPADIRLDAYPDSIIPGEIEHIAYESQVVNNVVVYTVDIRPLEAFVQMRSGMSTEVKISLDKSGETLLLPVSVVRGRRAGQFVLLDTGAGDPERRNVRTGISDGVNVEIIEGLRAGDRVVYDAAALPPGRAAGRAGGLPGLGSRR